MQALPTPTGERQDRCTLAGRGLHETFARIARVQPDAVALISGHGTASYGELDRKADTWATALTAAGVARGEIVPITLPRSAELVTAVLATLKTGAAYAVLDPAWPTRRVQEVLELLDARLLVAPSGTVHRSPVPVWTPPAGPVTAAPRFSAASVEDFDPCCVFFTSGTTGRPKGVLTPHRATARLFGPNSFVRFGPATVMPLAAPVSWDAFSLELWSVLLNGGTSLIVEEPYPSPEALRSGVLGHRANTVWLTSSLFNMIVDEDLAAFAGLRVVMIGGERLSAGHVRRFLRRHPGIALLNGYGPVETTIFATTHRITEADCDRLHGIPLGRPVPTTLIHVLKGSRVCTGGEMGEICIAGDGLALSYLGDPALTAARFTQVRIDGRPVRVYRTGDLGAWGSDGLLHFHGRADRQLKIRGHRVEPAEVERQIERLLPSVRACRVLARAGEGGAAQELVAFCVPAEPDDPLEGSVQRLRSTLVSYQQPAAVISVEAFPLTSQGKLDERALLAMASADARTDDQGVACDEPMVRLVAEVFGAVLGRAAVPLDVPFVELGGTSLGAGRVCARLAARLDRPVPVAQLYEYATVQSLARALRGPTPAGPTGPWRAGPVAAATAGMPLTSMQLVYLARHLANPQDRTSHCLLTWIVEGDLDRAALEAAIDAVHTRHEVLRAAYVPDPRPHARLVDVPAPTLELLPGRRSVDAASGALRAHLAGNLYPTEGEVWRTALIPAGSGVTVVGCVVHHIAFDGWSESVLASDLAAAYNRRLRDGPPEATAPLSMATILAERDDWVWQRSATAHLDRLRHELTGVPAMRWPAGSIARRPGDPGRVGVRLPSTVGAQVDALAATMGVPRLAVLLALGAQSLASVTGQDDFAMGVPVAQRAGPTLERAIGCHINMVCVRLRGTVLQPGATAIRAAGRLVTRALAAQDVPLADVLRLVSPPGNDRPPVFQTLFALQDNATPNLDLDGATTRFMRQPYLELPLELHTELWLDDGGMRMEVSFRPETVPEAAARAFARDYAHCLRRLGESSSEGWRWR